MFLSGSASDGILLVQLAWNAIQNSRKAVGRYHELTREASCLHTVLQRLMQEWGMPASPMNKPEDTCQEELKFIVNGCQKVLDDLNIILKKYIVLSRKERNAKWLLQCFRFGNRNVYLKDVRSRLSYYTAATNLFLNMISNSTIGRVAQQIDSQGGELREIRLAVNRITAHLMVSSSQDGSTISDYSDDDKAVWNEFCRELKYLGFSGSVVEEQKDLILRYFKWLGEQGILDEECWHEIGPHRHNVGSQQIYGRRPYMQPVQPRAHTHDAGPHYDGNLGLGSMLSVDSIDAATQTIPVGLSQTDYTSDDSEASSDSTSASWEYRRKAGSSKYYSPGQRASASDYQSCNANIEPPETRGSELIPHATALGMTTQDAGQIPCRRAPVEPLLEDKISRDGLTVSARINDIALQQMPQRPRYPSAQTSSVAGAHRLALGYHNVSDRDRSRDFKWKQEVAKKDESKRKRNKNIANFLFSGAIVAHVLIRLA